MLELKHYPFLSHLRADSSVQVILYRKGSKARSGRGLACWFRALNASLAVVPLDDRESVFVFKARAADFQNLNAQGAVVYRIADPDLAAQRIDFTVDNKTGAYKIDPVAQLEGRMAELAQQHASDLAVERPLRDILTGAAGELRQRIQAGLQGDEGLRSLGLEVVSVRLSALKPDADVEKALQTPTREAIQQQADEAVFQRRAMAVEKERAIQENELHTKIELAKRQELLLTQEGANERRRAQEAAEAKRIAVEAAAIQRVTEAKSQAEAISAVETARNEAERGRQAIFREMPANVLLAQAAQALAEKLQKIEHVTVTPDMLKGLLGEIRQALPAPAKKD